MQLQITGKQVDVGDALRSYIDDRLSQNIGRFFDENARSSVTLMREGSDFRVDCSVILGSGMTLQATGQAGDAHACFDMAAERLEKRLRRYKRRLKDHHGRGSTQQTAIEAARYVIDAPADEPLEGEDLNPAIIAEDTTLVRELTVGEAVMQLDITDAPFLFFKNASHGGLNVIYRRDDGNLGWIDPENRPPENRV